MIAEKKLFTPKEAAKFLREKAGREINVNRLGQLRRAGKVKSTQLGYNETLYTLKDLEEADVSLSKAGRKPSKKALDDDTVKREAIKKEQNHVQ